MTVHTQDIPYVPPRRRGDPEGRPRAFFNSLLGLPESQDPRSQRRSDPRRTPEGAYPGGRIETGRAGEMDMLAALPAHGPKPTTTR
jgi:hypothetical protein